MSKKKKKSQKEKSSPKGGLELLDVSKLIPKKYWTLAALLLLLALIFLFFSPVLFGDKTIQSGDLNQMKSMREYINKDKGNFPLWNPHIFCGMPAYATSAALRWFDLSNTVYSYLTRAYSSLFTDYNAIYTFSFILLGLSGFFLMRFKGPGIGISLFVAASMIFSTGIMVMFFIGHITKLMSLAILPFILMMLLKFQKNIKLIDILLLIFGLHLLVLGAHIQIVFYIVLTVLIYFIYFLAYSYFNKNKFLLNQLLKSLGVMTAAAIIAVLMSYDSYSQLFEYKPYSTRGPKSILETSDPAAKQSDSDFYEYATNWSFSPGEVLTFIVPSYYGFGKSVYKGPLTNNQEVDVNTYFGQMPFVDVAQYMGVIIFFLGLFGLYVRRKEPFVQFMGIIIVFFLIISFGRTLPLFYDLMFYYFPFFDNFRVPSMILTIIQIFFPVPAGLGLIKIISLRENKDATLEKIIKNTAIVFTILFVISLVLSSVFSDWFTSRIAASGAKGQQLKPLYNYMSDMFTSDLRIAFGLAALIFWLAFAYINGKLNRQLFIIAISLLVVIDLWRIDARGATFKDKENVDDQFQTPDYISAIEQQGDKEPYRILNLKQDGSLGSINQNSNFHVYFLQHDFYGYSAVKPRTYQDYIDVIGVGNWTMWRMLNVKYLIYEKEISYPGFDLIHSGENSYVYKNKAALPRAYFVDRIGVKSPIDILNDVKNNEFDPKQLAYLEDEIQLTVDKPDSTAFVNIVKYEDENIELDVLASGNNFLFLGDTYYPNGWNAYVDGSETNIYKVNHGFRGIVVPKGKHKVQFVFAPNNFFIGKYLSLILNVLLIGSLVFVLFHQGKTKKKKSDEVTNKD